MFAFGVVGAVTYRVLIRSGFGHLSAARDGQDRLFQHFRSLTEGIKELKLHRARRESYLREDVARAAAVCQRHNVAAELAVHRGAELEPAALPRPDRPDSLPAPPWRAVSPQAMTGYIIATLYLMGPLAGLLGSLSVFSRANVSLRKVEQLGLALSAHPRQRGRRPPAVCIGAL
jgi:putative pyoverdin transport system ATP-binding/permease protein